MAAIRLTSVAVKNAFSADGVQVRQNNDPAAGQDVFHLHFHVIPRYDKDRFDATNYELVSIEERTILAKKLKTSLSKQA